jgi:hypothetical protein
LSTRRTVLGLIAGFVPFVAGPARAAKCAQKRFALDGKAMKPLAEGRGACLATDRITVHGARVGYMYREAADREADSGWRFFAGDEDDRYVDDPCNSGVYDVNTIANYDPQIVPFLDAPIGSAFIREGDTLKADDQPAGSRE